MQFAVGNCKGIRIPGTTDNTHRNTRLSFYAADNWRVRANVSVNIGLRYQLDTHPLNNDLPKPDIARTLLPRGTEPTPITRTILRRRSALPGTRCGTARRPFAPELASFMPCGFRTCLRMNAPN